MNGVHVDPAKVSKIEQYPKPSSLPELRTFLGMCGYYRKFVLNFSEIAHPLFNLTSAKAQWKWEEPQEKALETLKKALTKTPVLTQPDNEAAKSGSKPNVIFTDASQIGKWCCTQSRRKG